MLKHPEVFPKLPLSLFYLFLHGGCWYNLLSKTGPPWETEDAKPGNQYYRTTNVFLWVPTFSTEQRFFFFFFLKLFSVDSGLTHSVANLTFLLRFTLGHLNHNIGRESLSLVLQICFFLVISTHVNGPIIHLPFIKPGFIFDFSFLCPPNLTHQQVLLTLLSSWIKLPTPLG